MRRVLLAMVFAIAVLPITGSASAAPLPVVTVTSGPTTPTYVVRECNDVAEGVDEAKAFVVHHDTPDASPLEVAYTTGGSAESGSDFEPLSGSVTIPANADSASVPVTALLREHTAAVDLEITISAGPGYTLGDPATVTLRIVVHRDPTLGPMDCNPLFQLGPDATNHEQTIRVGETPVAITTTPEWQWVALRVVDGELPPGISFDDETPEADFLGVATTPGDYTAVLDVCPMNIVFTCRQTTLVVHVLSDTTPVVSVIDPPSQLPATE